MTPEERAEHVLFLIEKVDVLDCSKLESIADAIHAAENDALERAAKMFLEWHDGYAAGKIRELKHPVSNSGWQIGGQDRDIEEEARGLLREHAQEIVQEHASELEPARRAALEKAIYEALRAHRDGPASAI